MSYEPVLVNAYVKLADSTLPGVDHVIPELVPEDRADIVAWNVTKEELMHHAAILNPDSRYRMALIEVKN